MKTMEWFEWRICSNIINRNDLKTYITTNSVYLEIGPFDKIINLLNLNNFIDFKVHRIYNTLHNTNEFFVILQKT